MNHKLEQKFTEKHSHSLKLIANAGAEHGLCERMTWLKSVK